MRSRFSKFNDGVLSICESTKERTSFKAAQSPIEKADFKILAKLNFEEKSRREQDMQFAESQGKKLTMKVKTRLYMPAENSHSVIINDVLYGIIDIDKDRQKSEMYIFLEEARKLNG